MKKFLSFIIIIFCLSNNVKSQCIDSSLINPFCICPFIYAPVCACNGIAYSNDCLAQCDGNTFWGPVDPSLSPGMPCSLSSCDISIIGDSMPCNYPTVVEAVYAGTSPVTSIIWSDQQGTTLSNGNLLTIASTGIYYVTITDSSGCVDSASINMQHMSMNVYSIPNPPNICLGDSIYLVHDTSFVNTLWISSPQSTNPATFFPSSDVTYYVQANDQNGCVRVGEIFVNVDTCVSNTIDFNTNFSIYPNPTKGILNIDNPKNFLYNLTLLDITGKPVLFKQNNRGSMKLYLSEIISGLYILKIDSYRGSLHKKILIE